MPLLFFNRHQWLRATEWVFNARNRLAGCRKRLGMLREPQHERQIINNIKLSPFVLSHVEGLRKVFQQPARNNSRCAKADRFIGTFLVLYSLIEEELSRLATVTL